MIIRAGDLDRTIVIMRAGTPTISPSRVLTPTWAPFATLRAKLIVKRRWNGTPDRRAIGTPLICVHWV